MTQEEKQLLIQDICARLKYGLICSIYREDDEGFGWRDAKCKGYFHNNDNYEFYFDDVITIDNIERLKPYLRPLSSMTDEEKQEYNYMVFDYEYDDYWYPGKYTDAICVDGVDELVDWLNEHYFDYRGLIGKDLALEAPNDMYVIKN